MPSEELIKQVEEICNYVIDKEMSAEDVQHLIPEIFDLMVELRGVAPDNVEWWRTKLHNLLKDAVDEIKAYFEELDGDEDDDDQATEIPIIDPNAKPEASNTVTNKKLTVTVVNKKWNDTEDVGEIDYTDPNWWKNRNWDDYYKPNGTKKLGNLTILKTK